MNQLQRAAGISEGRILDAMEAAELRDNAKEMFIEKFIEENLSRVEGNADLIAVIAMEAEEDKYLALFDGMAELSCTGSREKLDAAIKAIVDDYLLGGAQRAWSEIDD